ncbi:MAG: hypothetical protein MHMPM18_001873 [Marteilia pararefringens]
MIDDILRHKTTTGCSGVLLTKSAQSIALQSIETYHFKALWKRVMVIESVLFLFGSNTRDDFVVESIAKRLAISYCEKALESSSARFHR